MEFTVKEVTVFRVATFLNEGLCQIYFLRNIQIILHNDSADLDCQCDFNKDYCNKFDELNFDIDNYCFLLHVELL